MKLFLLFVLLVFIAGGCSASKPASSKAAPIFVRPPNGSPIMAEAEALRIGKQFAEEKQWDVHKSPTRSRFDAGRGEWQMFFGIKNRGGPFIVYVNDVTGVARYIVGE